MLNDGGICHGKGGEEEAPCDTGDRSEWDTDFAQERIEKAVANWNEDDDGERVDVLHNIVWNTVQFHLTGLGDKVVKHLPIDNPVNRVKDEDSASNQGSLELVDELVVPWSIVVSSKFSPVRWFGSVHFEFVGDANPQGLERMEDDGSLWWSSNVEFLACDDHEEADNEHAERQEESGPEANVKFHLGGCDGRERADIDAEIEDHVDSLDGDRGIHNDPLTCLEGLHVRLAAAILLSNQWADVRLDATGAETNDDHGDDETRKSCAMFDAVWQRGSEQNNDAADVDHGKVENCVVSSKVLVRDDCAKDRSHIAPKLEEVAQTGRALLTKADGAWHCWVAPFVLHVVLERA